MFIHLDVISGFMIGVEYLWDDGVLVIDIGICRIYVGKLPKEQE